MPTEASGTFYNVKTIDSYVLTVSEVPSDIERTQCALMCHLANCDAFVIDADDHTCKFMQTNSNPYENLYISRDIGMCHSLPAGSPSDVYTITTSDSLMADVFCDMDTLGGGWTVIQNRIDGSLDFYKTWEEYKQGFGFPYGEYWIGNENLYKLTSSGSYELRIEMEDITGLSKYAAYSVFSVASESENYSLAASGFTGTVFNSLSDHHLKPFSTWDRDNDEASTSCATTYQGGWWYTKCHKSNLNGPYKPATVDDPKAMSWFRFVSGGGHSALKSSKMMIRPC
ncbi:ficolin-1-like [Mizuhopecten yessoensis]|uniref:Ficolin-1 n=1 Tax=Mizuhopecten yessoensis TaxID=6573 RepID=A0A210PP14_MIZYE|nr:ficolin-1-like [Mizuhopecten yessoensis]OWF38217.1 Ficolin-1 [Mizuhopecten yessoensis]